MTLTIFERHPTADAYRVGGFYSPYCLVSRDKRFTDAELAAEYWAACVDADLALNDRFDRITATVRRFVTLPHFDEGDA